MGSLDSVRLGVLSVALILCCVGLVAAQSTKQPAASAPRAKAPTKVAAPARQAQPAPPVGNASLDPDDYARKQELLNSDRARQLRLSFDDWLSVQKIYKPEQIPGLKARFREKIAAMSSREFADFLDQMEAKLAILHSDQAAEARDWLGHFVSAKVVFSEADLKQMDLVTMTPSQIRQALQRVDQKRSGRRQSSQAFAQARENEVQAQRADTQRRQQQSASNRQVAMSSAASSSQSAMAPRKLRQPAPKPKTTYYVSPWGGVGFALGQ